jgi:hypothetical protein
MPALAPKKARSMGGVRLMAVATSLGELEVVTFARAATGSANTVKR